jgi:hypothetical protein
MNRILTALTAATAIGGAAVAMPNTASANPLVIAPVAAAAILGGTAVGGAAIGSAATANAYPAYGNPAYGYPEPVGVGAGPVVATGPTVTEPGCYFTNARVHGIWRRVQVCD